MDPFADHGPLPHRLGRPGHGHRLVLEVGDQLQRGFGDVDRDAPSGATMITRPNSVIRVAASPPRPPRSFRSAAKAG